MIKQRARSLLEPPPSLSSIDIICRSATFLVSRVYAHTRHVRTRTREIRTKNNWRTHAFLFCRGTPLRHPSPAPLSPPTIPFPSYSPRPVLHSFSLSLAPLLLYTFLLFLQAVVPVPDAWFVHVVVVVVVVVVVSFRTVPHSFTPSRYSPPRMHICFSQCTLFRLSLSLSLPLSFSLVQPTQQHRACWIQPLASRTRFPHVCGIYMCSRTGVRVRGSRFRWIGIYAVVASRSFDNDDDDDDEERARSRRA